MEIVLFDDQVLILEALKRSFQSLLHPDAIVTSYTHSLQLIDHIELFIPDIIVFDLITNDDAIKDVIEKTINITPTSFVVVYSNVATSFISDTLMTMGVKLYVHKSTPPQKTAELILSATKAYVLHPIT
jgi:DNA-binding NarL/FixJ family response regulator